MLVGRCIHRFHVLGAIVAAAFCSISWAQNDLTFDPYTVYVAQDETFARCGPSGDYYRTDPLRLGQTLEVYAETDDGWLGIRPPDRSFCWIPAETVRLDEDGSHGVVTEDRTVCWIGTHLGRARTYRWQVQLAKGEPVTILGRSEREGPDGPQLWFRIVPPSGEYRWVHRSQVVDSSEALVALMRGTVDLDDQSDSSSLAQTTRSPSRRIEGASSNPSVASSTRSQPEPASRSRRRQTPANQTARGEIESSGPSVLESQPVGSGLNSQWQANNEPPNTPSPANSTASANAQNTQRPRSLLATAIEFLGRPRVTDIDATPTAPATSPVASDSNWVAGTYRSSTAGSVNAIDPNAIANRANTIAPDAFPPSPWSASTATPPTATLGPPIRQAGGIANVTHSPNTIAQTSGQQVVPTALVQNDQATASRMTQIRTETEGADVDRLSLIFSRLIAVKASALEVEPVAVAARTIASTSANVVDAGRARLLAERVEQYQRIAAKRGNALNSLVTPVSNVSAVASMSPQGMPAATVSPTVAVEPAPSTQTGFLVQVYSARSNSPPFALTDAAGRTIAYVTPTPGLNLRPHLNSQVTVSGNPGFLTGLNTPHILAVQAKRPREE